MKKYPKVRRLGHKDNNGILNGEGPLYIKEKLDGANFRFTIDSDGNKLLFGSRNVEWKNERDTDKNFRHAVEYVCNKISIYSIRGVVDSGRVISSDHNADELVFFGEAMHPHTLEYDDTSGTEIGWKGLPSFIGFDIWCPQHGSFLTANVAQELFEELRLPYVNIIDVIEPQSFMDEYGTDYVPDSAYYDGKAEGIVLSNSSNGLTAKLVSEQFSEKHGTAKSGTDTNGIRDDDTYEVLQTYCTEARIRKHVHKLQDDGYDVGRQMMSELPVRVTRDIIEEEAHEFATSGWTIDFVELRSEVANSSVNTNCLDVIDTMVTEQATDDNGGQEVEA